MTKRVKIVLLGNPLPLAENPVRLAEELAMIDMISKGRLVSGFVRGGGQEQLATGVNPAFNRERFEEAHDLIVKTWTQPGPFRWEGTHYQHRVVNPWAVPLQKPHPRIWIPGVLSTRDGHLGGRAPLPVHRAEHLDRGDQADLGDLRRGRRRGRLHARPGEPRLPAARPRRRDRGEGARERPPVHVDAGRVHRPGPPGLEQPVRLLLARAPPRLRRVRRRPGRQPARPTDLRAADRRTCRSSPARPKTVIAEAAHASWKRPGRASWRSGATTATSATRTRRPASACSARRSCRRARDRQRAGPEQPLRGQRAGQHRLLDRHQGAGRGLAGPTRIGPDLFRGRRWSGTSSTYRLRPALHASRHSRRLRPCPRAC